MKNVFVIIAVVWLNLNALAQKEYSLVGHFPYFPNSRIELKGFNGLNEIQLSQTSSNNEGSFSLGYPSYYKGVAHLYLNGVFQLLVFLNKEHLNLYWKDLTKRDSIQLSGREYAAFLKGMKTFQDAEEKLAVWNYLIPLYEKDTIRQQLFLRELDTVVNSYPNYIRGLSDSLFVKQFLLARGLLEQIPKTAETYRWRAQFHIPVFMAIDLKALKYAGLYRDLMEGYTYLAERFNLKEANNILFAAIDKLGFELKDDPILLTELAEFWFTILEKKGLTDAAEYLAIKMLQQENCSLGIHTQNLFEQYRKLAIGRTAPNIVLNGSSKDLKSIPSKYTLVIFGASWCSTCQNEYPQLKENYQILKDKYDLEVVYISLDTNKTHYEQYYHDAPFYTYFDAKGWETQAAKDYHVLATPTYYLVDKELKILAKPRRPLDMIEFLNMKKQ